MTDQLHKDLAGSGTSNDMSERVFAVFTNALKEFRKIRWTSASALAQDSINHDVCLRCRPETRGGKFKGSRGQPLLYDIPPHEAEALFEMARTDYKVVHKEDERQKLRQMEVALESMAFQVTRKLRLTAAKFGKSQREGEAHHGRGPERRAQGGERREEENRAPEGADRHLREGVRVDALQGGVVERGGPVRGVGEGPHC